jgi:ATP-dependent RNA helicase RhlE
LSNFAPLGLSEHLIATIATAGLTDPTPIQLKAIPLALAGHDVMGLAQTGTGKTLAFGLPLLQGLMEAPQRPQPKAAKSLILAPTRELVSQIADSLRPFAEGSKLRIVTVVGGQSINRQVNALAKGTDILVATPGRLIDLMERGAVDLSAVKRLVLDEADQMLDMGFIHALRRIAPRLGTPRQTMLFSATMPKDMETLSRAYLTNPQRVQVSPPGKAADKITQSVQYVSKADKPARLREVLDRDPDALTLVFARTKHGAEKLMKNLVADGYDAASIHGNKSQGQRDRAIKAFRDKVIPILVATDVAARGIDIPGVSYVVNYELPEVPDNYVHRIGRTARAGREGEAIAFCSPEEYDLLQQIEKLMKIEIPATAGDRPTRVIPDPDRLKRGQRGGGGGGGGNRGRGGQGQGQGQGKPKGAKPHAAKPASAKPARRRRPSRAA